MRCVSEMYLCVCVQDMEFTCVNKMFSNDLYMRCVSQIRAQMCKSNICCKICT